MKSNVDSKIKLVLFDLDGVLIQENRDYTLDQILNPLADFIKQICEEGIYFAIITGRQNDEVIEFVKNYDIRIINSSINKVSEAEKIIAEFNIGFNEVFFMGDDILDIPLLQKVGFSAAPRNARREVKRVVKKIIPAEDVELMLNEIKQLVLQN
ncbi:MAG: HAD hydrolase family protein [Melioribacteraceae bacterium]|nr:HAD hydrolase family protein [Melioribacteraceae bacterium]